MRRRVGCLAAVRLGCLCCPEVVDECCCWLLGGGKVLGVEVEGVGTNHKRYVSWVLLCRMCC